MTPETIQANLLAFLNAEPAAFSAVAFTKVRDLLLEKVGPFVLYGGAARDISLHGPKASPRDFDLVVKAESTKRLRYELRHYEPYRNAFDGFNFSLFGVPFDVWRLEDTWAFKKLAVPAPTMTDLLRTSFFNIENILIEFPSHTIHDGGFIEGFATKTLELNLYDNPFPGLALVRTAAFSKRFGLTIGPRLSSWIANHRSTVDGPRLMDVQQKYYKRTVISEDEMLAILRPHT